MKRLDSQGTGKGQSLWLYPFKNNYVVCAAGAAAPAAGAC